LCNKYKEEMPSEYEEGMKLKEEDIFYEYKAGE
jgi:hypothetical protein